MSVFFILGGARSGKSGHAEQLAAQTPEPVCYIATAQIHDAEMQARIAHHQSHRPHHWHTLEINTDLSAALTRQPRGAKVIIDCLTLWLMQCFSQYPPFNYTPVEDFLAALQTFEGDLWIVSNEISMGVVPMGALSRDYVDTLGRLHQQIAAQAEQVTLMVAGIPLKVK